MDSPAVVSCERANPREEQANYFYVVWPEETVTTLSAAAAAGRLDPTLSSSSVHKAAAGLHRNSHPLQNHKHREHRQGHTAGMDHPSVASLSPPGKPLPDIEVGTFASPLTSPILSIADASPLVTQSSASVHSPSREYADRTSDLGTSSVGDKRDGEIRRLNLPCEQGANHPSSPNLSTLCHNGLLSASALLQTGVERERVGRTSVKTNGQGNGSCSSDTGNSQYLDYDSGGRRKRSRTTYYNLNGCLECEVKDAEIKTLRRRIQVMEEVVGLLNQKLSTLQQSSNGVLFSPMVMPPVVSQVVIPSTYTTPPTTSVKVHGPAAVSVDSNHCHTATSPRVSSDTEDASSDSASIAYAQAELCPSAEQRVELIPGTGVYVTLPQLEEARREAKNGTQLARKLMDAFWDRETLARSSLSSKSKYQYQQLDPNVISAIEAYCLNFDSNTHSRDLHACMTDKCCQARSRRGAPYKVSAAALHQNGLLNNGVVHNGLHGSLSGT